MRRAFSLLTAIAVILLIGTVLALTLSTSTMNVKQTSDLYLKEQAQLLAKSAAEYEILKITGTDFTTGCYNGANYTVKGFDINTTVHYIGNGIPATCSHILANSIATADSNGTVMLDVVVSYTDPATGERIRYHRRTLQKP
ncbi:type II secretion system protein [Hydrogenimonas sp.]